MQDCVEDSSLPCLAMVGGATVCWANVQSAVMAGSTDMCLGFADTAVGPFVLALKRFGASLKEFPNLSKYADTLQVRVLDIIHPSFL